MCVRTPVIIQFGVSYLQAEVGARWVQICYVNHLAPIFFTEYIQLDVVVRKMSMYLYLGEECFSVTKAKHLC